LANTQTDIIPTILEQGLSYLQGNTIMPRLCNRDYEGAAQNKGDTINVTLPPSVATSDVTPSAAPEANVDTTWETTPVQLNYHRKAVFYMTDKQRLEVMEGAESMAARSAIAALSTYIDATAMTALDVGASIATGTAGVTPFSTLAGALDPLIYLDEHKIMSADRRVVMSPRADGNLRTLAGFTSMDYVNDMTAMDNGGFTGNTRQGASWWMAQSAPTHTAGTGTSYDTNGALSIGATTITCDTGSGTILAGDVVSFAGDTVNKYVVATALSGGSFTIAAPGLKVAIPDGNDITVSATHRSSFAFAREAVIFASRGFLPSAARNVQADQVLDPMTGLTLRLEVTRQNKQDKWEFDALWGVKVVRPEGVIKILG
jgi:hypothetical protein